MNSDNKLIFEAHKRVNPSTRIIQPTAEEIKKAVVYGNFHYDAPIFRAVDELILSHAPMEQKLVALEKLNELTGSALPVTPEGVAAYITNSQEDQGLPEIKSLNF